MFLLNWVYDNIAYERKQSLKGVAELCRSFTTPEEFKRRIVAYFEVNEVTYLLQAISENQYEYLKWFEVFEKRNHKEEIIGNVLRNKKETDNLKLKLQRFLESNKNNTGLNFISGIVRLCLNEYNDQDGRARFEDALQNIKNHFDETIQEFIIFKTLDLGIQLDEIGRFNFSSSVLKIFPQHYQAFYERLGDTHSLEFIIKMQTTILKRINNKLYGELISIE